MQLSGLPRNAYTDEPEQHPDFIQGSWQLIFWLFVRPSAWCNQITNLGQNLLPDFCLGELDRSQWRHPALRRLLIQVYTFCPVFVGLMVGLMLQVSGQPVPTVFTYSLCSMATAVAGAVIGGTGVSVAFGLAFGMAFGLTSGITTGLPPEIITTLTSGIIRIITILTSGITTSTATTDTNMYESLIRGMPIGLAIGFAGSVADAVATQRLNYSLRKRVASIVIVLAIFSVFFGSVISHLDAQVKGISELSVYILVASLSLLSSLLLNDKIRFRQRFIHILILVARITILCTAAYIVSLVLSGDLSQVLHSKINHTLADGFEQINTCAQNTDKCNFFASFTNAIGSGVLWSIYFVSPYAFCKSTSDSSTGAFVGVSVSNCMHILYLGLSFLGGSFLEQSFFWHVLLPLGLISSLLGFTFCYWWPWFCYPFLIGCNHLLYRLDHRWGPRGPLHALRYHSAFWDGHQRLPLWGLDKHVVLVAERNPVEGQAAIEYLSTRHQRWAAQAAQIELDARSLERCLDVDRIAYIHNKLAVGELEGPASALLRSFSRVSEDVSAALAQEGIYNQRSAFKRC